MELLSPEVFIPLKNQHEKRSSRQRYKARKCLSDHTFLETSDKSIHTAKKAVRESSNQPKGILRAE